MPLLDLHQSDVGNDSLRVKGKRCMFTIMSGFRVRLHIIISPFLEIKALVYFDRPIHIISKPYGKTSKFPPCDYKLLE